MLTKRESWLLLALVLVGILVASVLRMTRPIGDDQRHNPIVQEVRQDRSSPAFENPRADVTLIVFTDYLCPVCRTTYPGLKRAVARDGRVRVVVKDWPIFGAASDRAAQVAIASRFQGIYPEVHDRLMTAPLAGDAALQLAVEAAGGNWARLQSDLVDNRGEIEAQVARNRRQAFALGLGGTPGFLVGPFLVRGALSESEIVRLIVRARQAK